MRVLRVIVVIVSAAWVVGVLGLFPAASAWLWMHEDAPLWGQVLGTLLAGVLLIVVALPLAWMAMLPLAWAWDPREFRKGFGTQEERA